MGTEARSEKWKQVEELFEAAQKQPADQRAEFLRQACPGDPEIRAEVESLLQRADSRDPLLDGSPLSSIAERAPALKPGDKLGNFEIVALMGRGGMGEVYRARDLRLKREIAIKTLPPGFAGDRDRIARFEREARAASALNHPNIVSVYDVGQQGGVSFIVSELVDGETLARLIERGPLSLKKLIEVSTQICDGLAAAHAAGVVHRDLKPGNIMLTRDGRVKILDFGLARQDRAHGVGSTTVDVSHPGMIMGTPGYMSPEQVRGEQTDARSDIFSLGVILYEMVAAKPAFRGNSSIEVLNSILKDDPPELPAASPPTLDRIIRRCIEKQPARRFQSAADLSFALQHLPRPPVREEGPKRGPWLKWAVLGGIAATAGAFYWLPVHATQPAAPPDLSLRRLTSDTSSTPDAVISPDGKFVAYSSNRADPANFDIHVQQVDGGDAIKLTSDPADDYDPSFSPDGTKIAFRSEREGGGIYVVSALGGEARELVAGGRHPRFSPDGRWLMYGVVRTRMLDVRFSEGLFIVPLSGGPPTQIAGGTDRQAFPVWSPDGTRILFQSLIHGDWTTWVYTVDRKDLKRDYDVKPDGMVIEEWVAAPPRLLTWRRVADAFVISTVPVTVDGTKVTAPPQKLATVTDEPNRLSAALDGRIVLSGSTSKARIWGLPIDAKGHAAGDPKQITDGFANESAPTLSRDGRRVAFLSERATSLRLFYKDLGTGRASDLSRDGTYWTPVFDQAGTSVMAGNAGSLYRLPLSGGLPKQIWHRDDGDVDIWDMSPDNKALLLLFESANSINPREGVVHRLDLESMSATNLLDDPELNTWQAHFSPDGRWVTFNATPKDSNWSRIYTVPFRKALVPRSDWIPITHGDWDDKPRFSSDGKMIFFRSGAYKSPHRLWAQMLTADMRPDGKPFMVFSPADSRRIMTDDDISVGPRLIVFTQFDLSSNIWLLESAKAGGK